jgi:hypothetical protein
MPMTSAQKKAKQRQRDRLLGWTEVTVKVAANRAQEVKDFAASLPLPTPPTDPDQLSLLDRIEQELAGGDVSPDDDQGSLF